MQLGRGVELDPGDVVLSGDSDLVVLPVEIILLRTPTVLIKLKGIGLYRPILATFVFGKYAVIRLKRPWSLAVGLHLYS